jgi:glycerol kinase
MRLLREYVKGFLGFSKPFSFGEGLLLPFAPVKSALHTRTLVDYLELTAAGSPGGAALEAIHIVGGGSRNSLLNQLVADTTGRTVIAGPSEATAIGNLLIQAIGAGELGGLEEAREVVRRSFGVARYGAGG